MIIYRIISNGISYKVQVKRWLFWVTEKNYHWSGSEDRIFTVKESAQSWIDYLHLCNVTYSAKWKVISEDRK